MKKPEPRPFPLINPQKKFILFTNAKCGGTILKSWFLKTMDIEDNFKGFYGALSHFNFGFVFRWFLHYKTFIPGSQIINSDRYLRKFIKDYRQATMDLLPAVVNRKSWFKFVVVRNPYDRLVSAYVDKFCGRDLQTRWVQKIIKEVNASDTHGNPAISFAEFVDYLATHDNDTVNVHWRRQSYVLQKVKLDKIIPLQEMAVELPKLEKKFNLETAVNFDQRRQANTYQQKKKDLLFAGEKPNTELIQQLKDSAAFPPKSSFYNKSLIKKVKMIYADDFKLHSFADPF